MLNISRVSIASRINNKDYTAFRILETKDTSTTLIKVFTILGLILIICMFLPWTQNIRAQGRVNTLNPSDRPQGVQSIIEGKIDRWFVREGDIVNKGDTILVLTEVKQEYLDPTILERTEKRIEAKEFSQEGYENKANNLDKQVSALMDEKVVKLQQNDFKLNQALAELQADSANYYAMEIQFDIAKKRLKRNQELYDQGIKSLRDLENNEREFQSQRFKYEKALADLQDVSNKISTLKANKVAIEREYDAKIFKTRAEENTATVNVYSTQEEIEKLSSDLNKLRERSKNYYLTSPIDGLITQSVREGIGEIVKPGENVVTIIPNELKLSAEVYVDPIDVPLLRKGQEVRLQFDGWPAVVFSGWPDNSIGTFEGYIFAIDQFISENGKYRVIIAPKAGDEEAWPELVRVGGGVNCIMLLKEVTVFYELWRQMNGFPPDFYGVEGGDEKSDSKIPLKKVK